jgi:hypothetical protein
MKIIPDHDSQIYRDRRLFSFCKFFAKFFIVSTMQKDMSRYTELFQRQDDSHDPLLSGRPYFSNLVIDNGQLSPKQAPQDERRPSFQAMSSKPGFFRTPAPPHIAISPQRFGSIGNNAHSPSYRNVANPQQAPAPPTQHPLASVSEPGPNLARRHTSADIRDSAGWPPQPGTSPFEAGPQTGSTNWPPSPQITAPSQGDTHIQSVLASYQLGAPRRQPTSGVPSRQTSPPPDAPPTGGLMGENGFSFKGPNFGPRLMDSAPQTRRSSMASNVHNLLNPAESGERDEDDGNDDRKRKRM